jgi:hypothetical protein
LNDKQLIDYCENLCRGLKALIAGSRINRMIKLAGEPKGYEPVTPGQFFEMRESMQKLVDLARKRLARPAGGLRIQRGRGYADVNGEVRYVISIVPRMTGFGVLWDSIPAYESWSDHRAITARESRPHGHMRLEEFQEWALEEVTQ